MWGGSDQSEPVCLVNATRYRSGLSTQEILNNLNVCIGIIGRTERVTDTRNIWQ